MIVGVDVREVLKIIPSRGTTYSDVRHMLAKFGWEGGPRLKYKGEFGDGTVIARIQWSRYKSHWVVIHNGLVYCPSNTIALDPQSYGDTYRVFTPNAHFTSFMTVNKCDS